MEKPSLITGVSAILLISPDAEALAEFYRAVLDLPLEDEVHEGVPRHYACELHGFAWVVSFRDPDGNHVELLQSSNRKPGD